MTRQQNNYHSYMAHGWTEQIAESRFLRGKSVPFPRLVEAYSILFQTGAVLGRAHASKGALFTALFAEPGRAETLVEGFREMGESLRAEMQSTTRNPLFTLAMLQLAEAFGMEGGIEEVFASIDSRISTEDTTRVLSQALALGVALGFSFPELLERLWREEHEAVSRDDPALEALHDAGLPRRGPIVLEEFEHQVLSDLAIFARAYFPALVEPLGLASFGS